VSRRSDPRAVRDDLPFWAADRTPSARSRAGAAEGPLAERLPRLEELIELRAVQVEIAELARLGITA
jgi:hypothetical protein